MKNFLIIWGIMLVIGISLCSCYEDKGNYDYTDPIVIKVDSVNVPDNVISLFDSINITPVVSPIEKEYNYWWGVYETNVQGFTPILDTICYTKDLTYFMSLPTGTYTLVFCAKDIETGVSEFWEWDFSVQTMLTKGTYLYKEIDGKSDYDFYHSKGKISNIMASLHEESFDGSPTDCKYLTNYKLLNPETGRYENTSCLFATSSQGVYITRLSDGSIMRTFDDVFYDVPLTHSSQLVFVGTHALYLCSGNNLYYIYTMGLNIGKFGLPKLDPHQLSPMYLENVDSSPLLFDELGKQLCSADGGSSYLYFFDDVKTKGLNNGIKNLMNIQGEAIVIRNRNEENDKTVVLRTGFPIYGTINKQVFSADSIKSDRKMFDMEVGIGNTTSKIFYFSIGNEIYSCRVANDYFEELQTSLPVGYRVSNMHYVSSGNDYYLFVSAYLGDDYFVYKYEIQAGNLVLIEDVDENQQNHIYTGKGKVRKMIII